MRFKMIDYDLLDLIDCDLSNWCEMLQVALIDLIHYSSIICMNEFMQYLYEILRLI